jgi:peptidoglycan/LPS O-acetylase OafA/YrhL
VFAVLSQTERLPRLHCLDWIRVIAFGVLIVYHVGCFYYWSVPATFENDAIGAAMLLTHPWRLALLFVVAGGSFRFMHQRVGDKLIVRQSLRLGAPLLVGGLILFPAQAIILNGGANPDWSLSNWLTVIATLDSRFQHLWFILYLLFYTAIWTIALPLAKRLPERLVQMLSGWGLVIGPIALLALLRGALFPLFGETHELLNDWYMHGVYLSTFVFGYVLVGAPKIWANLVERRVLFLALAVGGYAGVVSVEEGPLQYPLFAMLQWGAIAAVLGYGSKFLNRESRTIKYLNRGVMTAFLVHMPITTVAGSYLLKLDIPMALEVVALITITAAVSWLSYEAVRRAAALYRQTIARFGREPARPISAAPYAPPHPAR